MIIRNAERAFLAGAIAFTIVLIWAGGEPATGHFFGGRLHWIAHFGAFALLGAAWAWGLPRVRAPALALAVAAFGFAHEAYEIAGHGHGLELRDACVDAAGAIFGVLFAHRTLRHAD